VLNEPIKNGALFMDMKMYVLYRVVILLVLFSNGFCLSYVNIKYNLLPTNRDFLVSKNITVEFKKQRAYIDSTVEIQGVNYNVGSKYIVEELQQINLQLSSFLSNKIMNDFPIMSPEGVSPLGFAFVISYNIKDLPGKDFNKRLTKVKLSVVVQNETAVFSSNIKEELYVETSLMHGDMGSPSSYYDSLESGIGKIYNNLYKGYRVISKEYKISLKSGMGSKSLRQGIKYFTEKDYFSALNQWEEILDDKNSINRFAANYNIALYYCYIKDYESAIYFMEKALEIKKDKKLIELLTDIKMI
jgi:tetratricopeptide (TPR) repeat protein